MTKTKTSTTTPKKQPKKFYIDGVDEIKDKTAPIVSGEFITEDDKWQGQTVQVESDTHLEDDKGIGEAIIIRTFEFALNPIVFKQYQERTGAQPTPQDLFTEHKKGIIGMLWKDGLTPAEDIEPRIIFSKGANTYLIMVGARPQTGQLVLDKPKTLSEIANDPRKHKD